MVGGEGVLSQFRPNNELGRNFDVLAARILNELRLDIEKGHFDIARDLVASIGGVFAQIVPGKSAEIQAALTALIDSQMQQALVEQPQVNSTAEPVVSAEAQATSAEVTPPLKQISETEASPQIAACITSEQVAELIKEWEIPVSPGKLDDGTEVAREPVPGYLAVIRMKTLVDSIIKAADDQLDGVIEEKQKLVPRFGGLREKVIALARAERIKTMELPLNPARDEFEEAEPEAPEVKISPEAISFGLMFQSAEDVIAVSEAVGIPARSVRFMREENRIPNEINPDSNILIWALARRAIAKEVLEPMKQRCKNASVIPDQDQGGAYTHVASNLRSFLDGLTDTMLSGREPKRRDYNVSYPNDTEPAMGLAQMTKLQEQLFSNLKPFVSFIATDFGVKLTLRHLTVDVQNSRVTPT